MLLLLLLLLLAQGAEWHLPSARPSEGAGEASSA
jgi:hypothetical protein